MKVHVLYHETEDIVRLIKAKLEDGFIDIGNKTFDVDDFKAKKLKTLFGYSPLYMLKWDCVNPPEEFNPRWKEDKDLNPETLHKALKLRILGNMLKVKREVGTWKVLIIGLIFGGILTYFLIASNLIII